MGSQFRKIVITAGLMMLASGLAEAKPKKVPPPPPPPPPPPVVVYIPPRPTPPLGAAPSFQVPPLGPDGLRQTINSKITPVQTLWNFRSAFNVAALDCLLPEHADILIGYKAFLKTHKLSLLKANRGVDAEFRKRYGAAFIRPREAYMTKVYNYYALPPTLNNFCEAALIVAREAKTVKPLELTAFAQRSLVTLDHVFENFYISFDQYRADAAAWDAKYAPKLVVPDVTVPVVVPTSVPTTVPAEPAPKL